MRDSGALEAVFQPVRTPTTFEETVERLGGAIRTGLLPPGTKLPPERELADRLRISRSTLRQAITALVQSGHLTSVRGRGGGTFVAPSPPLSDRGADPLDRDALGVLDLRVAIEVGAVTLSLERAEDGDIERLEEWVERMAADPEDFEVYRRADVRFHIGLAETAHSPRLVAAMTDVHAQLTDLLAYIAHPPEVLAHANAQHERLLRLLRRRDRARALRLIREHIEGTEHILAGLI